MPSEICTVHKQYGIDKPAWYRIGNKMLCADCKNGIPITQKAAESSSISKTTTSPDSVPPFLKLPPPKIIRSHDFPKQEEVSKSSADIAAHKTISVPSKGNHHIPEEKRIKAERLFREGKSVRQVVEEVGIAQKTALKIRKSIIKELPLCSCGRPNGHRGWCPKRFSESPDRQETVRKLQDRRTLLPKEERLTISQIRELLEEEKTEIEEKQAKLQERLELIEEDLHACDRIGEIHDRIRRRKLQ